MAITFDDMTIKHSIYTPKVPFQYTERACMVFFWFRNLLQKNDESCREFVGQCVHQKVVVHSYVEVRMYLLHEFCT